MNHRFIHRLAQEPFGSALTSVWPTGGDSLDVQLASRGYHHTTGTDQALMAPAIADHAVTMFTRRGDVVLDPDCGTGTTLVEALRAGRHAIGLTTHPRWWHLARANVTATKASGAATDGMVLLHRPSTMAAAQTAGLTGRVALLLTPLRPIDRTRDETHDGTEEEISGLARLRTLLRECRPLLRPGGHVVITCAPQRHPARHDLLDLPSRILALGAATGLAPVARCLTLTANVRGRRVFTRATLTQRRTATRIEHATGHPVALPAHHTALVFRVDPDAVDPALTHPIPPLSAPPCRHRTRPSASPSRTRTRPGLSASVCRSRRDVRHDDHTPPCRYGACCVRVRRHVVATGVCRYAEVLSSSDGRMEPSAGDACRAARRAIAPSPTALHCALAWHDRLLRSLYPAAPSQNAATPA